MLRGRKIGSAECILVSLGVKELLVEAGVGSQREDSLEVTPTHELFVEVHEHFELVFGQLFRPLQTRLLSELRYGH